MIQTNPRRVLVTSVPDTRPTVCHVIHSLGVGGAEVLVDQMVRGLSDEFRCVVAVLDEVGEIGEQLRRDGIPVHLLHRQPGIDHRCAKRLRDFADREGAVVLHAHQYTPFFQAMLSRGFNGRRPVVLTEHGRHFPDLPSRKRSIVNRILLRKCDRLIGCGQSVATALIGNEGLPSSRVEVIYNGVNLQKCAKPSYGARARIRAEFGIGAGDPVAIQVARLHELKDHRTALRTMQLVCQHHASARLLIVGEGDQRSQINHGINELGLQNNVLLTGSRSDIPDLLAAADVFLMTSISEGIPLTIIEAMAAGLPVVSTAVGGIPEMIEPGITGCLASAGDTKSLSDHLCRLFREPETRKSISAMGKESASRRFSLAAMLQRYREVYRDVLGVHA